MGYELETDERRDARRRRFQEMPHEFVEAFNFTPFQDSQPRASECYSCGAPGLPDLGDGAPRAHEDWRLDLATVLMARRRFYDRTPHVFVACDALHASPVCRHCGLIEAGRHVNDDHSSYALHVIMKPLDAPGRY